MDTIGDIIRSRRLEFGLTQGELSKLSNVGINTLTSIERNEGNPTVGSLARVLDTLGMELTAKVKEL